MSDDDDSNSDIARIANEGNQSDSESDNENKTKTNQDTQKNLLIEKEKEEPKLQMELTNKDKQPEQETKQGTVDKSQPIQEEEYIKEDNDNDNMNNSGSSDSNLEAIMNQKDSNKNSEDEGNDKAKETKETISNKVITNTNKTDKEKVIQDSLIEDKEIVQAIKEPQKNNDNNPGNTTLTFDSYKPEMQYNSHQIKNENKFFQINQSNSNNTHFNQQPMSYSGNQQYRNNYNNGNSNNYRGNNYGNRNNYNGNRPPFNNERGFNGNYGNRNNDYKPSYIPPSERIDNDPIYKEHRILIHEINNSFPSFTEIEIIRIIKTINQGPKQTMFEIINHIFREHAITKANKAQRNQGQRVYNDKIDINETSYPEDLIDDHIIILKQYKIYSRAQCLEKNIPEEFGYSSTKDQRRQLKKDSEGNYNYIPRESSNPNTNNQLNPDDFYALNQEEINYHSLVFHTRLCRKQHCTNELLCLNAHSLSDDFRILYDYKKLEICLLMSTIAEGKMINVIESYLEHFPIPITFSLHDFKIFKCEMEHRLDRRLCTRYHIDHERRRPPEIFRYCNTPCPIALFDDDYDISRCKSGDYCHWIHSKYEFNYHWENFRRQYPCGHEKKKGRCDYFKTCYGIHKQDYSVEREEDDPIDKRLEEAKNMISNTITCKVCNELPKDMKYIYYSLCDHYCCEACFRKSVKEGKKCLFCGREFANNLMRMNFDS